MKRHFNRFSDGVVELRLIEERDLAATLSWRNRDDARIWFKTKDTIAADDHRAWFARYLGKEDDYHFIVEVDGRAVGQCAVYGTYGCGLGEIGRFLAAPGESGNGYIRRSCALLVKFSAEVLRLQYLYLEVYENNARAMRVYSACGFSEESRANGMVRMSLSLRADVRPLTHERV
ncbi:MAG: GNAT family N-acetyltransferase [Hyphomicrobium sp.]|jgi:RimJ/RimL family protein N-acetyltransferase